MNASTTLHSCMHEKIKYSIIQIWNSHLQTSWKRWARERGMRLLTCSRPGVMDGRVTWWRWHASSSPVSKKRKKQLEHLSGSMQLLVSWQVLSTTSMHLASGHPAAGWNLTTEHIGFFFFLFPNGRWASESVELFTHGLALRDKWVKRTTGRASKIQPGFLLPKHNDDIVLEAQQECSSLHKKV